MSKSIADLINSRIEQLHLTNYEIADRIKCTEGTVRNIRRGDLGSRSFEVVSSLCKLLDIPIDLLAEIEKSNIISQDDMNLIILFRNADERSRSDAVALLKMHQSEPAEPSIIDTALKMRARAIEQNTRSNDMKQVK